MMRHVIAAWVLICGCGGSASAQSIRIIAHDPKAAATSAEAFARAAFLEKDVKKAHGLLATETRKSVSVDKLAETLKAMHPRGYPAEVKAIEYESQPGQRAMNIFLKGTGGDETFHYRLYMVGDSSAGYAVAGVFRGSGPYPSARKQPL